MKIFHHQAVKDIAKGFKVAARARDGVVEAIEKEGDQFVVGVQFHPEGFVSEGDDTFLPLFEALIEASK
jgi:putative glutamine amidotransferase